MKAAFSVWNHRIAPVFDFARQILLVEVESGHVVGEAQESLPVDPGTGKWLRLVELGVDTLVCGAISRPLQAMVAANGIRVIPFVGGDLQEVIQAWMNGRIQDDLFVMPGCRGRGDRFEHRPGFGGKEDLMKGRNRGGIGSGSGQGRGRGGQGEAGWAGLPLRVRAAIACARDAAARNRMNGEFPACGSSVPRAGSP